MRSKWLQVRSEGRILPIEPPPGALVHRSWDLGVGHSTSVWFFAVVGPQVYILDHYAARGVGLEHYCDVIEKLYAERGWQHGTDFVPHDARVKEWTVGRTRVETMQTDGPVADAGAGCLGGRRHQRGAPDVAAVRVSPALRNLGHQRHRRARDVSQGVG